MELTQGTPARGKKPFDPPRMLALIREATKPFPRAMLFELADRGHISVFEQVCACVISIRTLDEVSLPVASALFKKARAPKELLELGLEELERILRPSTFARQKAGRLLEIARIAERDHAGRLPCGFEALTALPGVGPKCANLVLGIACRAPAIGVDVHVHRVTNRWGYAESTTPEATLRQLESKLPRAHWTELNELLVPFGKHICTGRRPKCSRCPVLSYCRQVGVADPR